MGASTASVELVKKNAMADVGAKQSKDALMNAGAGSSAMVVDQGSSATAEQKQL